MGFLDKFKKNNRPNFEEIDSIEKAKEELSKGNLEILYLISPMFGGAEDIGNMLYVPIGVNKIKEHYDNMIADLLEQGKVKSYKCIPEYKGKSVIPSKLTMISGKDGIDVFKETIEIW